jgi:hypothetical protein
LGNFLSITLDKIVTNLTENCRIDTSQPFPTTTISTNTDQTICSTQIIGTTAEIKKEMEGK